MRVIEAEKLVLKDLRDGTYLLTREAILNAPTFEAEPVLHGEWIEKEYDELGGTTWACSNCGHEVNEATIFLDMEDFQKNGEYLYCLHCGVKMIEG